ncbi:hypothetical protein ACHHRT_13650 [Desulfurivibrio sp. D14AmB]|uniref:hypothetical protein n=1 Tax=Desulfurivibrio sp. D14AmB TaxID=3374370 RepID=UPI00376ED0F0
MRLCEQLTQLTIGIDGFDKNTKDDDLFNYLNSDVHYVTLDETAPNGDWCDIATTIMALFSERHYMPHGNPRKVNKFIREFDVIALRDGAGKAVDYIEKYGYEFINSLPFMIGGYLYVGYILKKKNKLAVAFIGGQNGGLHFIYLPSSRTCLLLNNGGDARRARSLIPHLLINAVKLKNRLDGCGLIEADNCLPGNTDSGSSNIKVALCEGSNSHLGVALVSDYAAIEYLMQSGLLSPETVIAHFNQGYIDRQEYSSDFSSQIFLDDPENIVTWHKLCGQIYLFVRPATNYVVPHSLAERFVKRRDTVRNFDVLNVLINIRTHTRTCNFTADDFLKLHNHLRGAADKVHYFFDGVTQLVSRPLNKKELEWLNAERNLYSEIVSGISEQFSCEITAGLTFQEKLQKYISSDIAIMTYGSGFLYPYILKIKTIMLASYSHALNKKIVRERDGGVSEMFDMVVISPPNPSIEEKSRLPDDTGLILDNSTLLSYGLYNENYTINFDCVGKSALDLLGHPID